MVDAMWSYDSFSSVSSPSFSFVVDDERKYEKSSGNKRQTIDNSAINGLTSKQRYLISIFISRRAKSSYIALL